MTYESLKKDLEPIFQWYKTNYHLDPDKMQITELVINEGFGMHVNFSHTAPEDFYLPNDFDYKNVFDNDSFFRDDFLDDDFLPKEESSSSSSSSYSYDEDIQIDENNSVDLVLNLDDSKKAQYKELQKSHTAGAVRLILEEIYDYIKWKENDYSCQEFDEDDNHFIAECYFWEDRVELLNVDQILFSIRSEMLNKKKTDKSLNLTQTQMKNMILRDFYQSYADNPSNKKNVKAFVERYLLKNSTSKASSLIAAYRAHKGLNDGEPLFNPKTLRNKLHKFNSKDSNGQKKYLEYNPSNEKHGCAREKGLKVTDETIKCMITLLIDFPTLSANAITEYLNSPFGTNYNKPLHRRTVQRYLRKLDFSFKSASFAPPNRNSIGLRIFRVAWCSIIEKIVNDQNVLIGFIDEAAVTTNEGPKKGWSYIGITPLVNAPLSKIKLSVISLVLPGFGVLYRFVDENVDNKIYATFLKDVVRFIRRYICNEKTEIVFIEDNCPIHSTQTIEDTIQQLKIALLPIVQYSPSLNGVVEGLFGYVKSKFNRVITQTNNDAIKAEIQANWKEIINDDFNLEVAHSLYYEWCARMKGCQRGEPIYSGHIDEKIHIDFTNLQYITVNRLNSESKQ